MKMFSSADKVKHFMTNYSSLKIGNSWILLITKVLKVSTPQTQMRSNSQGSNFFEEKRQHSVSMSVVLLQYIGNH